MLMDVFSKSEQSGVMRLMLSYLDSPHPPSAVLTVVANRNDPKFVRPDQGLAPPVPPLN